MNWDKCSPPLAFRKTDSKAFKQPQVSKSLDARVPVKQVQLLHVSVHALCAFIISRSLTVLAQHSVSAV